MLKDILARLPDKPPAVPLPDRCRAFLRQHEIPDDIIADIEASSYAGWIPLGPLLVVPMPRLVDELTGISACIENGFLTLAGGANGDPVAVDRRTRRMFYVSHDTLWDEEWSDFMECVHPTPYDYSDFWDAAILDESFPCDYYEAEDRWPV